MDEAFPKRKEDIKDEDKESSVNIKHSIYLPLFIRSKLNSLSYQGKDFSNLLFCTYALRVKDLFGFKLLNKVKVFAAQQNLQP